MDCQSLAWERYNRQRAIAKDISTLKLDEEAPMTTNLAIDDDLINEAFTLGQFKSKEDTVVTALREFINRRKQLEVIDLFGQFDPDPDYDYKQGRLS
jgi:hypothetical protein